MTVKNIKKLPFPDFLLNTDCKIILDKEENNIDRNGSPIRNESIERKCIFSEKAKRIITEDGKEIVLIGTIILKGDIAPMMKNISSGIVIINEREYQIYQGARPRNPDGTIHHTTLLIQ